jgi:hypothetical protein
VLVFPFLEEQNPAASVPFSGLLVFFSELQIPAVNGRRRLDALVMGDVLAAVATGGLDRWWRVAWFLAVCVRRRR